VSDGKFPFPEAKVFTAFTPKQDAAPAGASAKNLHTLRGSIYSWKSCCGLTPTLCWLPKQNSPFPHISTRQQVFADLFHRVIELILKYVSPLCTSVDTPFNMSVLTVHTPISMSVWIVLTSINISVWTVSRYLFKYPFLRGNKEPLKQIRIDCFGCK